MNFGYKKSYCMVRVLKFYLIELKYFTKEMMKKQYKHFEIAFKYYFVPKFD